MNKNSKKTIKGLIVGVMAVTFICTPMMSLVVQATELSTNKEEVIYINLDGDGSVNGVYAVNIFTDENITDYGDYSEIRNMNTNDVINYKDGVINIKNSSDKLYYEGIMENADIPWNIDITYKIDGQEYSAEDVVGKSGALTVEVKITENNKSNKDFFQNYALQCSIKLDTEKCKNIVSDGATVANVGKAKQFTYTIMPNSEKKIILSSDVADFSMEGIEINGIKLNLGVSSESIDTTSLTDEITKLQDAVSTLDSGATELNNGAGTLNNGVEKLNDGINSINEALNELNSKSTSLTTGSAEVKVALDIIQNSLNNVNITTEQLAQLSDASTVIKSGIEKLVGGLDEMNNSIDSYYGALSQSGLNNINDFVNSHKGAIESLGITNTMRLLYDAYQSDGINGVVDKLTNLASNGDKEATELFNKYTNGDTEVITSYITSAGKLINVEELLKVDIAYIEGSNGLISGISGVLNNESGEIMNGALTLKENYYIFDETIQNVISSLGNLIGNMNTLKAGINNLVENYDVLDSGISQYTNAVNSITLGYSQICAGAFDMVNGTAQLYHGTKELVQGTGDFSEETSGLNENVNDEIDSMLNNFTGGNFEPISFVSNKNTNVGSVQFVIKGSAIEKVETVIEGTNEKEDLNLWQKFLKLFGLY